MSWFMRKRAQARDERGIFALVTAIAAVALLVASALVMDLGLLRVDRQVDQSAADAATLAGAKALSSPDGKALPYAGVCAAIRTLTTNDQRFASMSPDVGTWTDGTGAATGFTGCSDSAWVSTHGCDSASSHTQTTRQATWARFTWSDASTSVTIQSGFDIASAGWQENSLTAAQANQADDALGCYQIATVITHSRTAGLGAIVGAGHLSTTIHSVARVDLQPGGDAPAMILLQRTGCATYGGYGPALQVGSAAGGSWVHVYGGTSQSGDSTRPGTIHADDDGTGCSGAIFAGKAADGIVAYAAPLLGDSTQPDPNQPGMISSYASYQGASSVVDASSNVYGSSALNEAGAAAGTKNAPVGRQLVTRAPVDERYLPTITSAVSAANSSVFNVITSASAASANGYTVVDSCSPTQSAINALNIVASSKVYVNCTDNNGYTSLVPILAKTVVFAGSVNPSNVAYQAWLPNADHVYIFGKASGDAINMGAGDFSMHTAGNIDAATGNCSDQVVTGDKAMLFVKAGDIKGTGGLLQLCRTTVVMMGGQASACLPAPYDYTSTTAPAPTQTPCSGGAYSGMGGGQISLNGTAGVDWTAPNTLDQTSDAAGNPTSAALAAWGDANGPEDLALWDESASNSSSRTDTLGGGGALHVAGVFMVPNASPFQIGGSAGQTLVNAQYIASSVATNGNNAQLKMQVDPNSAITLPQLKLVGLVR